MNGSISKGTQSVWSVLDKLRETRGSWKEATIDPKTGDEGEQASDEDFDDKSFMVYSPLQPNASSLVEIAQSEICTIDEEGDVISEDLNEPGLAQDDKGKGKAKEQVSVRKDDAKS